MRIVGKEDIFDTLSQGAFIKREERKEGKGYHRPQPQVGAFFCHGASYVKDSKYFSNFHFYV